MKGSIYLEPRSTYDTALIDIDNIVYSLEKLIDVLMDSLNCDYFEAMDFYCFNIECLHYKGLAVLDDISEDDNEHI